MLFQVSSGRWSCRRRCWSRRRRSCCRRGPRRAGAWTRSACRFRSARAHHAHPRAREPALRTSPDGLGNSPRSPQREPTLRTSSDGLGNSPKSHQATLLLPKDPKARYTRVKTCRGLLLSEGTSRKMNLVGVSKRPRALASRVGSITLVCSTWRRRSPGSATRTTSRTTVSRCAPRRHRRRARSAQHPATTPKRCGGKQTMSRGGPIHKELETIYQTPKTSEPSSQIVAHGSFRRLLL